MQKYLKQNNNMKQQQLCCYCTILFTILSITAITIFSHENNYNAYALRQVAGTIELEINPGESKSFEWGLASDDPNDITTIHLRAEGDGSEFISFVVDSLNIEPSKTIFILVTISIPADYPGGITLSPKLYAAEFGESGGATVMNIQMLKIPVIVIALNEDSSLHVDWDKIKQQELELTSAVVESEPQQQQQQQQSITTPSEEKPTGFNIVSENKEPTCGAGTKLVNGICIVIADKEKEEPKAKGSSDGGGCLIATATYGTELAPQVQMLRELRDDTIIPTQSGASFMNLFNSIYYSFSQYIADLERESPIFRETVKIAITPLLYTLSILQHTDINSEYDMLGYGISIVILNVSLYIGIPVIVTRKFITRYKSNNASSS